MEFLAGVDFTIDEIKRIVKRTNGCIVWGGAVNLAPADDKIIKIEYPLSLDPRGQLLASVMAKKRSVGSDYVVIDIPVGVGAKIEDMEVASQLAYDFMALGRELKIATKCLITDGSSPVGRGIGPSLEARDVLEILDNRGPTDLANKSLDLAGALLELSGKICEGVTCHGKGREVAEKILTSGKAKKKMMDIIREQGGDPKIKAGDIPLGDHTQEIVSDRKGRVRSISNKAISLVARVAGAPRDKLAGVYLEVGVGDSVKVGDPLYTIYSENGSKLEDSVRVANAIKPVQVGGVILKELY
jgi:AMP phosphorylase